MQIICTIVAVLLHYFLLVWFAWMLIEGIYLYVIVITVFGNNKDQLRLYGACAYGEATIDKEFKLTTTSNETS